MIESLKKNKKGMILMLCSSLCLCIGQLLWKRLDISSDMFTNVNIVMLFKFFLTLLPGFLVYVIGAVFMLLAFSKGELSVLQPMNSMGYVFFLVIASVILKETVTPMMIVGVIIIIAGVFCIGGSGE